MSPPKMRSFPDMLFPLMAIVCSDNLLTSTVEKCCNPLDDILLLIRPEFWIDRQRKRFPRGPFRFRKIAFRVAEICKTFLKMKRDRIINVGPDTCGRQED